jgi:hypothetical protein
MENLVTTYVCSSCVLTFVTQCTIYLKPGIWNIEYWSLKIKGEPFRIKGKSFRTKGEPFRTKGELFRTKGELFRTKGELLSSNDKQCLVRKGSPLGRKGRTKSLGRKGSPLGRTAGPRLRLATTYVSSNIFLMLKKSKKYYS